VRTGSTSHWLSLTIPAVEAYAVQARNSCTRLKSRLEETLLELKTSAILTTMFVAV
jgi:hypothetical protein